MEEIMFWKIVLAVAAIWIALAVVGALVKGLFWILVVSAVVFGVYLLGGFEQRTPVFGRTTHHTSPATRRCATGRCPSD